MTLDFWKWMLAEMVTDPVIWLMALFMGLSIYAAVKGGEKS